MPVDLKKLNFIADTLRDDGLPVMAQEIDDAIAELSVLRAERVGASVGADKGHWAKPQAEENPAPLRPCPEEPEHLCCYPACNCAPQRVPAVGA